METSELLFCFQFILQRGTNIAHEGIYGWWGGTRRMTIQLEMIHTVPKCACVGAATKMRQMEIVCSQTNKQQKNVMRAQLGIEFANRANLTFQMKMNTNYNRTGRKLLNRVNRK